MRLVKTALATYGFAVLRRYIPKPVLDPALKQTSDYFLGVVESFTDGYALEAKVESYDKLHTLDAKVWETKGPNAQKELTFPSGPMGFIVNKWNRVIHVDADGPAANLGVKVGWVVLSSEIFPNNADGTSHSVTFWTIECYTPLAIEQKWGTSTTRGYQKKLGLGKCTDPINMQFPALIDTQLYMRPFLAELHGCLPSQLCWQPDGGSFKARPHHPASSIIATP